jgi:hypothetical protein
MARVSPLGAVTRGVVAGLVGTAAMTAHQEIRARIREARHPAGERTGEEPVDPWQSAPAPAQVARRVLEGVFQRQVPPEEISTLTNAMHWTYGAGWGAVYGLLRSSIGGSSAAFGPAFGFTVWAMSYVELVPMGLYEPPWDYAVTSIANDIGYHLTYGTATAMAYAVLDAD